MTMPPPGQWPPPPQGHPQGPPQWNPQPGPPPKGGNKAKWILGGLALLVVVVVTVVATLLVTRGSSGSTTPTASPPSTSVDASDVASANDRGPAGIITEDPTCAAWSPINDTLAAEQRKGWDKRDPSIPGTEWSPEQRAQYDGIAKAMRSAADQTVALAKRTPHRVMRELYEQSIAYGRAYADSLSSYQPQDEHLALTANSTAATVVWICEAIKYGAAAAREPLVVGSTPPLRFSPLGDPANPTRFIAAPSSFCTDWTTMVTQFGKSTSEWTNKTDPNIPAVAWSPDQQALYGAVIPLLQQNADEVQQLGIQSDKPIVNDFATLSAQYRRAYVQAIPSYGPVDTYLNNAASELLSAIDQACKASGG